MEAAGNRREQENGALDKVDAAGLEAEQENPTT
jgi:hypothetical protein